jgi:hypothetical protein
MHQTSPFNNEPEPFQTEKHFLCVGIFNAIKGSVVTPIISMFMTSAMIAVGAI